MNLTKSQIDALIADASKYTNSLFTPSEVTDTAQINRVFLTKFADAVLTQYEQQLTAVAIHKLTATQQELKRRKKDLENEYIKELLQDARLDVLYGDI